MLWRGVITERDGVTPCFARIGGIIGALCLVGIESLSIVKGHDVDPVQFATAWGILVGATAGAARMKLATEDDAK